MMQNRKTCEHDVVMLRFVPFIPGYRPTDEDATPGLGCSDCAAMVTGDASSSNRTMLLLEVADLPDDAAADASITIAGQALRGWNHRPVPLSANGLHRIELLPDCDLAGED